MKRHGWLGMWMGLWLVSGGLFSCTTTKPGPASGASPFSFALIGDMPYAVEDVDKFERLIGDVNAESVQWVLHVGDIKTGGTPCTDAYLEGRLALFQQFEKPFIFIPGDNEWTDCHRQSAGEFEPLERLETLRSLFYPNPGYALGQPAYPLTTQATQPGYEEFPEHVRWVQDRVVFAGLHIVGSGNARAPFPGRTDADDREADRRMAAAVRWMEEAFEEAERLDSPGLFLMIHANPGFSPDANPAQRQSFQEFLTALERETIRFGRPVLLAHGDSHYFRIDKPLVSSSSGRRIENFTRVETFGAGDVHWLRVTVDSRGENVFRIEQQIVERNLENHELPD